MILRQDDIKRLDEHWAVQAVPEAKRKRATAVAEARLVSTALGQQLTINFEWDAEKDEALLDCVATAYEVAAAEGLDAVLHPSPEREAAATRTQAGAFRAYELRRVLAIPDNDRERVFHVLHVAALAYVGDRWIDLRRWVIEHRDRIQPPSVVDVGWDRRVLYRIYEGWLRLFRKDSWDDLDGIATVVVRLREEQRDYEGRLLGDGGAADSQAMALRLIALYHWARATEQLARYMLDGQCTTIQGYSANVITELDTQFEQAGKAASACADVMLGLLVRWLHVAARRMVAGSLWMATATINSRVTRFVRAMTHARQPMIELLPPQRAALVEEGLLDPASRAVVVDLPTSGGKTTLAQFRMLQALNQFAQDGGWIAYVAPTRALVAQLLRRLRRDFGPLGIKVEQVSGGVEIDTFEEQLLGDRASFDILICTPEKLGLIIRNKKVQGRPLALAVVDEAHNIEDAERGVRIELLLATIRQDCPTANYLLLMPFVPRADALARWLGQDQGKTISLGTTAWQPNERIVGLYRLKEGEARGARNRKQWRLTYETVITTPKTIHLRGVSYAGDENPLDVNFQQAKSLTSMTAAMAKVFSGRGTSIAVADSIPRAWSMGRVLAENMEVPDRLHPDIALVQNFLSTEIGPQFELIGMLRKRVGVHHAGLPDEARSLIEWLAEEGHLRVLCATTTIAQGINFPVSSVFLSRAEHPTRRGTVPMTPREFWNLAGRAGRVQQDSVGVVGIAAEDDAKAHRLKAFLAEATADLASRLLALLDEIGSKAIDQQLNVVIHEPQWADFRTFVAHLLREVQDIQQFLNQTERILRNTFAYTSLRGRSDPASQAKAARLVELTQRYAKRLSDSRSPLSLADATGFDPEGVTKAIVGLREATLDRALTTDDWEPASLFGNGRALPQLVGVMMQLPLLNKALEEIAGDGMDKRRVAQIAKAWVNGGTVHEIATQFFKGEDTTASITDACKGIYRALVNTGVWGLAALSRMPGSGIPWDTLTEDQRRSFNLLPAFLYHGVNTEEGVLMRMNQVPRSIAKRLGGEMRLRAGGKSTIKVSDARDFVRSLSESDWNNLRPSHASMSGAEYREVWRRLSGES